MDDVFLPNNEEKNRAASCGSAAKLLESNPRLLAEVLGNFFERHRDELLGLAAKELMIRLLQDHRSGSTDLFLAELVDATAEKTWGRNGNKFLDALAHKFAELFLENPLPKEDPMIRICREISRRVLARE